jgi:alpha-galactosidase
MRRFVDEYQADWLWFDLNTDPRPLFWDHYEESDRRGIAELGYYRGFYRVLDTLRDRYPNVWIECCANGGRLIDLAMLRRCHSIWKNDYVGYWGIGQEPDADISRSLTNGINCFLPAVYVHSGFYLPEEVILDDTAIMDEYHYLSHFAGSRGELPRFRSSPAQAM